MSLLIPYRQKNKWGYCNYSKNIVIPPKYDSVSLFSEGLAYVYNLNENYCFIDYEGRKKIELEKGVSAFEGFKEGLCMVGKGYIIKSGFGFINRQGEIQIPLVFDKLESFSNGLARFSFLIRTGMSYKSSIYKNKNIFFEILQQGISKNYDPLMDPTGNDFCGFIDREGNLRTPFFEGVSDFFEGIACAYADSLSWYIDLNGKPVFQKSYPCITPFHQGRACVGGHYVDGECVFFIINKMGNQVSSLLKGYSMIHHFHEGLAKIERNGKWGYMDLSGFEIIKPLYDDAENFSEGLACVKQNERYGFIDKSGYTKIPFMYNNAFSFQEGLAGVSSSNKYGFIDSCNKRVIDFKYTSVGKFIDAICYVYKGEKHGYINHNGVEFWND